MTHSANPFAVALALLTTGTIACLPNTAQHHVKEVPSAESSATEESAGCGAKAGCGASSGCGAKTETQPMAAEDQDEGAEVTGADAAKTHADGSPPSDATATESADVDEAAGVAASTASASMPVVPDAPAEAAPRTQSAAPKKAARKPPKKPAGAQAGCGEGSCAS